MKTTPTFPRTLYQDHLATINDIYFTNREIDVMVCLLSARKTSKIASFLDINPRTVEVHVRNIMTKLECNSREVIIDFLETSSKLPFLREYYALLRVESAFEKSLKDIAKLNCNKNCFHLRIPDENDKYLFHYLKSHLELVGFEFSTTPRKKIDYLIFFLSKKIGKKEATLLHQNTKPNRIFLLLQQKENFTEAFDDLSRFEMINFLQKENYYFSFLAALKKLLPNLNLDKIITEFKDKYEKIDIVFSPLRLESTEKTKKFLKDKIVYKRIYIYISSIAIILGSIFLISTKAPEADKDIISPNLNLPKKSTLLDRPELISQIDDKLKKQKGIQVVALVGVGGAGKTTIARQYAYQKKLDYVWEINAETKESLMASFAKLAKDLAQTKESQQALKGIEETGEIIQKEKSLIEFVSAQLKAKPKWLLIYDNVETFKPIQDYFPHALEIWGQGKVIITTRDNNIDSNQYINHTIDVGELTVTQKISLFRKIVKDRYLHPMTSDKEEKIKEFLEQIPSFPLDVSIAAFYLKETQVSLTTYLENIAKQDNDFTNLQKDILNDAGGYTKTRYGIITLSLEHVIETHAEFKDLLLFISLLDSQNIPKELLAYFKNDIIVAHFILNLRKYSLLTNQSLDTTLSMHRSTQATTLTYLTRTLNLEKNSEPLRKISESLIAYMNKVIEQENVLKMKNLILSCEAFLNHRQLLKDDVEGMIKGELGVFHYFIGDNLKAKTLLEEGTFKLTNFYETHPIHIAFFLGYLGNVLRDLGDYHQGKTFLKKSLSIYKKHDSSDHRNHAYFLVYLNIIERYLGNYNAAKDLIENAIVIHKQYFPENKNFAAWALMQLGAVESRMGNYEKAQKLLEESLFALRRDQGPNHDLTSVLNHLAGVYIEIGEHKKAINTLEECLRLYAADFPDQLGSSWLLSYLGLQDTEWQQEKAKNSFEKILEKYKGHFHGQYIYVVSPLRLLSKVCIKLGNHKKGKIPLEQILLMYQRNYGNNHIETARLLKDLSVVYLLERDLEASENFAYKALTIFEENEHPDKYTCLEILSRIYQEKSKLAADQKNEQDIKNYKAQAIFYLNQALEFIKIHFNRGSSHEKRVRNELKEIGEEVTS